MVDKYFLMGYNDRVACVGSSPAARHGRIPGCSAVGSAPALGAGCRGFKSLHSDHSEQGQTPSKGTVPVLIYPTAVGVKGFEGDCAGSHPEQSEGSESRMISKIFRLRLIMTRTLSKTVTGSFRDRFYTVMLFCYSAVRLSGVHTARGALARAAERLASARMIASAAAMPAEAAVGSPPGSCCHWVAR